MKQMHVDMLVPAKELSKALETWMGESLPVDISVRSGKRKGKRVLVLSVYGTTQEDILDKIEALNKIIG